MDKNKNNKNNKKNNISKLNRDKNINKQPTSNRGVSARTSQLDRQTRASQLDRQTRASQLDRQTRASQLDRQTRTSQLDRQTRTSQLDRQTRTSQINRQASGYNSNTTRTQNRNNENYNQRQNTQRRPKRRNRNLNILSKAFTGIIFFMIISYFGVSILKGLDKKPIQYETIEYGSINNHTQAKGVIIRDEVIYSATKNGVLAFNIAENEKVKDNEHILTIKNQTETMEEDIEAINKKILELQDKRADLSLFSEDVKKVENQMQKIIEDNIYNFVAGDMSNIYETKEIISKKMTTRNQMLLSENTGSLQELTNKKNSKETKLGENIEKIYSKDAGILSYQTDGLEEIFTFENRDKLTKEQTRMQEEKNNFKMDILENEPAFKIVKDNTYYIASYIKTENVSSWAVGQNKTIYINDAGALKPLEVEIEKIDKQDKETYVLMKSNKNMIDFIDQRSITFEINKPKEGFKIATSALAKEELLKIPKEYITEDNQIIKKTATENISVPVQISGEDDTNEHKYVDINSQVLSIGDTIISPITDKEYQLNEIFTVQGIYIVNSGTYILKKINTENSVQDDQFIILDPNKNTNIKLFDRYAKTTNIDEVGTMQEPVIEETKEEAKEEAKEEKETKEETKEEKEETTKEEKETKEETTKEKKEQETKEE